MKQFHLCGHNLHAIFRKLLTIQLLFTEFSKVSGIDWYKKDNRFGVTDSEIGNEILKKIGFELAVSYASTLDDCGQIEYMVPPRKNFIKNVFVEYCTEFKKVLLHQLAVPINKFEIMLFEKNVKKYYAQKVVSDEVDKKYEGQMNLEIEQEINDNVELETKLLETDFEKYPETDEEAKKQ
uniref:Uncharacterized protein n=1 Tax=Ditylenchus dipsaci TaxID=166011 RepID=A0A915ENM6_9BILA